jgi:Na+-driven multidrug efflux pump
VVRLPSQFYLVITALFCSFLSFVLVTATLVSKANASGNHEDLQDAISQALIVGVGISLLGEMCGDCVLNKTPSTLIQS